MNKYLKYILAFISPFVILYFMIAFLAFNFNVESWHIVGRFCLVSFGFIFGVGLVLSIFQYEDQFKNEKQ